MPSETITIRNSRDNNLKNVLMKLFAIIYLFVAGSYCCYGQVPDDCGACKDCKNDCGPFEAINLREVIRGDNLKSAPYNGIIHIGVKRLGQSPRYSTASFIGKNLLLTANHNVMSSKFIVNIEFCLVLNGQDQWITLKKSDFEILHFTKKHDKWNDVALIKLKNTNFLKNTNYTIFRTANIDDLKPAENIFYHLTGFPCDKPDILVDKKTQKKGLEFDTTNTIISYSNLFTCTGDSGAPLWIEKDNTFYILGIHHGGDDINAFPEKDQTNVSRKLTSDILKWIISKTD